MPLPLSVNVRPAGSAPPCVIAANGKPSVVTVNVPPLPTVNVAVLALVNCGASSTVSMNDWTAGPPTPLEAERLSG